MNIGDRIKLIETSDGKQVGVRSNSPSIGKKVILLEDSRGNQTAHLSGSPHAKGLLIYGKEGYPMFICSGGDCPKVFVFRAFHGNYYHNVFIIPKYTKIPDKYLGPPYFTLGKRYLHLVSAVFHPTLFGCYEFPFHPFQVVHVGITPPGTDWEVITPVWLDTSINSHPVPKYYDSNSWDGWVPMNNWYNNYQAINPNKYSGLQILIYSIDCSKSRGYLDNACPFQAYLEYAVGVGSEILTPGYFSMGSEFWVLKFDMYINEITQYGVQQVVASMYRCYFLGVARMGLIIYQDYMGHPEPYVIELPATTDPQNITDTYSYVKIIEFGIIDANDLSRTAVFATLLNDIGSFEFFKISVMERTKTVLKTRSVPFMVYGVVRAGDNFYYLHDIGNNVWLSSATAGDLINLSAVLPLDYTGSERLGGYICEDPANPDLIHCLVSNRYFIVHISIESVQDMGEITFVRKGETHKFKRGYYKYNQLHASKCGGVIVVGRWEGLPTVINTTPPCDAFMATYNGISQPWIIYAEVGNGFDEFCPITSSDTGVAAPGPLSDMLMVLPPGTPSKSDPYYQVYEPPDIKQQNGITIPWINCIDSRRPYLKDGIVDPE